MLFQFFKHNRNKFLCFLYISTDSVLGLLRLNRCTSFYFLILTFSPNVSQGLFLRPFLETLTSENDVLLKSMITEINIAYFIFILKCTFPIFRYIYLKKLCIFLAQNPIMRPFIKMKSGITWDGYETRRAISDVTIKKTR